MYWDAAIILRATFVVVSISAGATETGVFEREDLTTIEQKTAFIPTRDELRSFVVEH